MLTEFNVFILNYLIMPALTIGAIAYLGNKLMVAALTVFKELLRLINFLLGGPKLPTDKEIMASYLEQKARPNYKPPQKEEK